MTNKTTRLLLCLAISIVSALVFTTAVCLGNMQRAFDNELYDNVIRLHILAESDSDYDQEAKLRIRDGVKDHIYSLVSNATDTQDAKAIIQDNIADIQNLVDDTIRSLGYSYCSKVSFCEEYYPVRYYEGFSFPSGKYRSLKITLGCGKGKNWWCVLYPTVCNSMATDVCAKLKEAGISKRTSEMICSDDKKYEYGMYILELLKFQ